MMMDEQQITREHIEEARQLGLLVDLNGKACQAGFSCHCEMSENLYRSLFWKYPSAREHDTVDALELLEVLKQRIENSGVRRRPYYYIRPPRPIWWLHPHYFFKILVFYQGNHVESIVILSFFDTLDSFSCCLPRALPASLLVRMLQTIRQLWPLCFHSERPLLRSLNSTARELLGNSPLYAEVNDYLDSTDSSPLRHGFSREEYRKVTLRSLLQQLEVTAAVAEKMSADIRLPVSSVLALMANYVGIVPVNEDGVFLSDEVQFH